MIQFHILKQYRKKFDKIVWEYSLDLKAINQDGVTVIK